MICLSQENEWFLEFKLFILAFRDSKNKVAFSVHRTHVFLSLQKQLKHLFSEIKCNWSQLKSLQMNLNHFSMFFADVRDIFSSFWNLFKGPFLDLSA